MRQKPQEYWDKVAILLLFDFTNTRANIGGRLKAQKLTFLYELKTQLERLRGSHYRFFRYTLGPFSKDLANDIINLQDSGFITKTTFQLTNRARFLLEYLAPYIERSQDARRSVEIARGVGEEYGRFSGMSLTQKIYRMAVPIYEFYGEKLELRKVPPFVDILDPLEDPELSEVQPFPEDIIQDVEREFSIQPEQLDPSNPEFRESVARVIRAAL